MTQNYKPQQLLYNRIRYETGLCR